MGDYLDGEDGQSDSFSVENRNIILLTQMTDWVDAYSGQFENTYLHSDTQSSSYLIVGGTSNPMKGVSGSIFEGKEYATDTAGVHYLDRPCGIKPDMNIMQFSSHLKHMQEHKLIKHSTLLMKLEFSIRDQIEQISLHLFYLGWKLHKNQPRM